MVVTDDSYWCEIFEDLLMLEDYDVLSAAGRTEAMSLLKLHCPHLFICKIPDVTQLIAFTEAVLAQRRQLPFLYIGPFRPSDWHPDHVLFPPFLPQEFLLTVKHLLMRYS